MGLHYSQIDLAERRQIQDMVVTSIPVAVIARRLGRHRSAVHRKIGRNFRHTTFRDRRHL
jgi:IS30 family transposase